MFDLDTTLCRHCPSWSSVQRTYVIARSCLQRRGNLPEGTPYCLRRDVAYAAMCAFWQAMCANAAMCVFDTL